MSNCEYLASRTPRATFSKSQKTARLRASWLLGINGFLRLFGLAEQCLQTLEVEIHHRRDVEGDHLREQGAAAPRQPERHARATASAEADGDWQAAHQRRAGGHHDRAEADHAGLNDRLLRGHAILPLR